MTSTKEEKDLAINEPMIEKASDKVDDEQANAEQEQEPKVETTL